MTPENVDSEDRTADRRVTLASRTITFSLPRDSMWPLKLHNQDMHDFVAGALPQMVQRLSVPIDPATQDEVRAAVIRDNPPRRTPWVFTEDKDGAYSFYSEPYEIKRPDGTGTLYSGVRYHFDKNGRLVQFEYIEGDWSYDRGIPSYQEFLTYDDDGYLTKRSTWERLGHPLVTDLFDYTNDSQGHRVPARMTRTMKVQSDHESRDSKAMIVDLANYEQWLAINPYGFRKIEKDELEPKKLNVEGFTVAENRRGILFKHPEQLEHALVIYGDGRYLEGETALSYNEKAFMESSGPLGSALFSAMAHRGDMGEFVRDRIMDEVQRKWKAVQQSKKSEVQENVHFSFDYDGAGNFHKTSGEVQVTKQGLELTLSAAYVGDQVENALATAVGKTRGLRSATIDIPVNQAEHEGYFLVDLTAVCKKLGITVSNEEIGNYLDRYLSGDRASLYRRDQVYLWQDKSRGVSVHLRTERTDYDADADLDTFFSHDGISIWGPLPKNVRSTDQDTRKVSPKVEVNVKPTGDPFEEGTALRSQAIVKGYTDKLQAE